MATDNESIDIEALVSGREGHSRLQLAIPKSVLKEGESGVVSGFTSQGFSLTGSASWEGKPVGTSGDGAMNMITTGLNSMGTSIAQGSMTTRAATVRRWVSSEPAAFQIEFILVAYRQGMDIRKDVGKLFRCVYPDGSGLLGFGMMAPMGYTPSAGSAQNTATLKVGKWFRADGLLVDDVSAEFSREVTQDGYPLYANVSVSLSPWRMLYGDDMVGFLDGSGRSTINDKPR
jgi:hypothetical protein